MTPTHSAQCWSPVTTTTGVSTTKELQAIEMFAWALLRFPEAPEGLRLGLLRTLEEDGDDDIGVGCQMF